MQQIPSEVWTIIFSFIKLFDDDGSILPVLKAWNVHREQCHAFCYGLKLSTHTLNLSTIHAEAACEITRVGDRLNPFIGKKSANNNYYQTTDDVLEKDEGIKKIFDKQDIFCPLMVKGIVNGFPGLKVLNLDNIHRLQNGQIEELTDHLTNLESISLVKCWNISNFDISKLKHLKQVRIFIDQIRLRINLVTQQYQYSKNDLKVETVGGLNFFFKTVNHNQPESSQCLTMSYRYRVQDGIQLICPAENVPCENIRIIFAGKLLEAHRFFVDYSVQKESTLIVLVRK